MNAWIWVAIVVWVLFPSIVAAGLARAASRENPPMPDEDMTAEEFDARMAAGTPTNVYTGSPTVIIRYPEEDVR